MTSSAGFTGVDMSCSMVPLSHSLAMVREVRTETMTDIMRAISPGMTKFLDFSSGLYQTLLRRSMTGGMGLEACLRLNCPAMPVMYPRAIVAVLELLPSRRTYTEERLSVLIFFEKSKGMTRATLALSESRYLSICVYESG